MTVVKTVKRDPIFLVLLSLTAFAILMQSVWAGAFERHGGGHSYDDNWVRVHDWGARAAILLAILSTVVAGLRLRNRRGLWIGSGLLAALLIVESYIGGLVHENTHTNLSLIHFPLALALISLTVWLLTQALRTPGVVRGGPEQPKTNVAAVAGRPANSLKSS